MSEEEENGIEKVRKIQAQLRRVHVQNEMRRVRSEYERIFREIEGDEQSSDLNIVWPREEMCYPKFVSKTSIKPSGSQLITKSEVIKFVMPEETKQKNADVLSNLDNIDMKKLSRSELANMKANLALEVFWIQQAIDSRIQVHEYYMKSVNYFNNFYSYSISK